MCQAHQRPITLQRRKEQKMHNTNEIIIIEFVLRVLSSAKKCIYINNNLNGITRLIIVILFHH